MMRFTSLVLGLFLVCLTGALFRSVVEPPEFSQSLDAGARYQAERRAAERSMTLAHVALAGAGLALMLSEGWPMRAAGGLMVLATGLQVDLAGVAWQVGVLVGFLLGVPLLMAGWVRHRFGRAKDTA